MWVDSSNVSRLESGGGGGVGDLSINSGGGNVGIGTTSPTSSLHITESSSGTNPQINIENDAGSISRILTGRSAGGSAGDLVFQPDTGKDSYFSVGNVGIGTAAPASMLHVSGNVSNNAFLKLNNTSTSRETSGFQLLSEGTARWTLYNDVTATDVQRFDIYDETAGASRMTIDSAGNVGIGTTSPATKFAVHGTSNGVYVTSAGSLGVGVSAPAGKLEVKGSNADANSQFRISTTQGDLMRIAIASDGSTNFHNGTNSAFINSSGVWTDASDIAYKKDIVDINYGLDEVLQIQPRFYRMKADDTEQIGFIAQELELIIPEAVSGLDGSKGVAYGHLTAVTINAIQELSSVFDSTSATTSTSTILSLYQGSTTPAMIIDADGNIGVGTTSPDYKMHIIGDVAATAFVNISTKTSKKDITYITDEEKGTILEKLEAVDVAEYHYKHEDDSAPMRLGLIAEEAPADVLSISGKGVDIYKLVTFTLAGVQELADKIKEIWITVKSNVASILSNKNEITELRARIESLESQLNLTATSNNSTTSSTSSEQATSTTTPGTDTTPPVITINGNNPAEINIGDTYSDLGATVTDDVNENLGVTTYLDGIQTSQISINTASSTTYTISYTATDQAGNTATSTRTVNVNDLNAIVIDTLEEDTATSTPEIATSTPATTDTGTSTPQT